ncbi:GRB10-interacting GYF protein 2-like isoform X2 [Ornithodoros turicata]|uniref:GRB10-interacting GYF protein 2-like isoform X2 n=1 Tax=Ornithodoros turicata TaxID=34597 RepID=UPI00313A306E
MNGPALSMVGYSVQGSRPRAEGMSGDGEAESWFCKDQQGRVHGPYPEQKMASWFASGKLRMSLAVKRIGDPEFHLLGDLIKASCCVPFQPAEGSHDDDDDNNDYGHDDEDPAPVASQSPEKRSSGAWGGYEANTADPMKPSRDNPETAVAPKQTAQPCTWASVCQGNLSDHTWSSPRKTLPLGDMSLFPSLGGHAFSDPKKSLWQRRREADEALTRWCYEALSELPSYVHVPTFVELLRDVESNDEIREYVRIHLGRDDDARGFAEEFIRRRAQWKWSTGRLMDCHRSADEQGGGGRRRMQRLVDASMLGFVVGGPPGFRRK